MSWRGLVFSIGLICLLLPFALPFDIGSYFLFFGLALLLVSVAAHALRGRISRRRRDR